MAIFSEGGNEVGSLGRGSARTGEEGDGETAQGWRNHRELGPTGAGGGGLFSWKGVMVLGPGV